MKTAIVFGGARSGNAVVRLLLEDNYHIIWADDGKLNIEADIDTTNIEIHEDGIPMSLREARVDIIVKNPGIPDFHPVITWLAQRYFIYNEVDVAFLHAKKFQYAAITGTNGKTTTTSLLHHLLSDEQTPNYVAGNIGMPLSQIAYEHSDENANIALELSSFQIEGLLFFKPKVATILNLSPDHIDRYLGEKRYYDAKFRLLQNMDHNTVFLRNIDDKEIMERARYLNAQIIDFSLTQKADVYLVDNEVYYKDRLLFNVDDLMIKGPHNIQNAMVAVMMASLLGVELDRIQSKLKTFTGVIHRLQLVDTIDGVKYYNDSKATNPNSTMTALSSFDTPVILLAGGSNKNTSYEGLYLYASRIKELIVFGETAAQLQAVFEDAIMVDNLEEAFKKANEIAVSGDTVLLSPASASYDQYQNFEERGNEFIALVKSLHK